MTRSTPDMTDISIIASYYHHNNYYGVLFSWNLIFGYKNISLNINFVVSFFAKIEISNDET